MDIIANLARVLGFQQQAEERQRQRQDIVIQNPDNSMSMTNIKKEELEKQLKEVRDYRNNFEKNYLDMRDEGDKEILIDLNNQENQLLEELNNL
jgi:hypothetical protein